MAVKKVTIVTSNVDLSASAGTLQNVAGLSFAVLNGETVDFSFFIHFDAANNIGLRVGVNGPTGTFIGGTIQSNSTTAADYSSSTTIGGIIFSATAGSDTPDGFAIVSGTFKATANGTIQFQAANEGSGAMTIYANSNGLFVTDNRLELTLSDNGMSFSDAANVALGLPLSPTDSINLLADYFVYGKRPRWQDALAKTLADVNPSLTQTAADDLNNWQEAAVKILELRLNLAESINNLADAYSQVEGQLLPFSDDLNAWVDYFTYRKKPRWQDSLVYDLQSSLLTRTLADDLNQPWQDAYSQILEYRLTFSDQISQSDSLRLGYGLALTDNANNLTDSLSANEGLLIPFSDSLTLTDAYGQIEGQLVSFSDNANNLSDALVKVTGQLVPFSDSFTLSDAHSLREGQLIGCEDSITLFDSIFLNLQYRLALSDSIDFLADNAAFSGGELRFGDQLIFSDDIRIVLGLVLNFSDNANNLNDVVLYFVPRAGWVARVPRNPRRVIVEP